MESRVSCVITFLSVISLTVLGCKVGIWPFMTIESLNRKPAIYPRIQDCFEEEEYIMPVKCYQQKKYQVLKFTEQRYRYVDIEIENPDAIKDFFISLFVFAETDTGTLFHYKAKYVSNIEIDEIKLSLVKGFVELRYCIAGNCDYEVFKQLIGIPINTWKYIGITRKEGELEYTNAQGCSKKNDTYTISEHKNANVKLAGKLRVGGTLDNPIGEFVGRLVCLRIYSKKQSKQDTPDECFMDTSEPHERSCTTVVAKFLWPLNNMSLGYDAIRRISPSIAPSLTDWRFESSVLGLQRSSAAVFSSNGTNAHRIEICVPSDMEMCNRISVATFVRQESTVEETLLKLDSPNEYNTNIVIKMSSSKVNVILENEGSKFGTSLAMPNSTTGWVFIAAQFNRYWEELSLIVGDKFNSTKVAGKVIYSCVTLKDLKLQIGGNFNGRIVCMSVFNTPLSESTAADLLINECNKYSTFIAPAQDDPKPILLWPLNKDSQGYEVLGHTNMVNPPNDLCWRFNKQTANPIESGAVEFFGADKFSLELGSAILDDDMVSLAFFVKPYINVSGTILEVTFGSSSDIKLLRIGINSKLFLEVENTTGTCAAINVTFPENNWFSVVFQNKEPGNFELFVDITSYPLGDSCGSIGSTQDVKIILGKSNSRSVGDFHGQLVCLSIFNKTMHHTMAKEFLTTGCVSREFSFAAQSTLSQALYIWTLGDVAILKKPISDMELLTANKSLLFDGSSVMHVLVNIYVNKISDMTIGIFIRPKDYAKGTIVMTEPTSTSSECHLKIAIEKSTVVLTFDQQNPECEAMRFEGVESGKWHLLMIRRIESCKSLVVTLDDEIQYASSNCFRTDLMTIMKLRLGGQPKSFNNFRGELSCLALFNTSVNIMKSRDSMIDSCNDPIAKSDAVVEDNMDHSNTIMVGMHERIKANYVPIEKPAYLNSINVKSLSHCARICTLTYSCRSFILHRTANKSCALYNFITTDGLMSQLGSDYYGMVYLEEASYYPRSLSPSDFNP